MNFEATLGEKADFCVLQLLGSFVFPLLRTQSHFQKELKRKKFIFYLFFLW